MILNPVPLIYATFLMPASHCLDCFSFAVSFETEKHEPTNFVLFKIVLDYSESLAFSYKF